MESLESVIKNETPSYDLVFFDDEEKWNKSFTSVSKQNLNSEVKEKEFVSKIFLNADKRKIRSIPSYHKKPRDFIDNKLNLDGFNESKKNTNEGIGRGAAFQRRMENSRRVNRYPHYLQDHYLGHPDNLLLAPISCQVKEIIGDVYSDAIIRRSLDDVSHRSSANDEGSSTSCGLERALSDISLATASRGDPRSSEGASALPEFEWRPKESLMDSLESDYDQNFPKLK